MIHLNTFGYYTVTLNDTFQYTGYYTVATVKILNDTFQYMF